MFDELGHVAMRRNFPLFFPSSLSFLCPSFFVCCDEFFFFLGRLSSSIKNQFFPTIFFLSCSFLIGKSKFQFQFCLSLFLFLSPHLKKTPRQTPRPCLRSARDRSIESRFVTSHREIQTTLLRHRRERKRKKWRTFCSHRGCARVRDGTRTGNPSIRPPP